MTGQWFGFSALKIWKMNYLQLGVCFPLEEDLSCWFGWLQVRLLLEEKMEDFLLLCHASPQMWFTGVGMNGICLFHDPLYFNQGVTCSELGNREDGEAWADDAWALCSFCSHCLTGTHFPPPKPEENGIAADLCWFSSHCLKTAAFWDGTSNRDLTVNFYLILSFKKNTS